MIKKLLGIVVLGLLLSVNAYAEVYELKNCRYIDSKSKNKNPGTANIMINTDSQKIDWETSGNSNTFDIKSGNIQSGFIFVQRPHFSDDKNSYSEWNFNVKNATVRVKVYATTVFGKKIKYNKGYSKIQDLDCDKNNLTNKNTQSAGISFTIKDKKEQCAAIGFKPATDKFADCVLRLVELDLQKQISNPTIVAQDSGNQAIVDELKRSNNMQQSQFLMNLSNQLLNPSSPASSMSSSSCTVRGGTIKTINCW